MNGIDVKVIPHSEHRYDTIGDWYEKDDIWHIRVSRLGNWKYEFLIALHELVEMAWCKFSGIKEEEVTKFDMDFLGEEEPGDDYHAPYYAGHQYATAVERLAAVFLGVNWKEYDKFINDVV